MWDNESTLQRQPALNYSAQFTRFVEYSYSFASFLPFGHFLFLSISERRQGGKSGLTIQPIQFPFCSTSHSMSIDREL